MNLYLPDDPTPNMVMALSRHAKDLLVVRVKSFQRADVGGDVLVTLYDKRDHNTIKKVRVAGARWLNPCAVVRQVAHEMMKWDRELNCIPIIHCPNYVGSLP